MGSWVLIRMGISCQILVCVALVVVGVSVEGEDDAPYGWSALSFLSSQNNNKRSADDLKENSMLEVDDMSASESKIEAAALIASEPDPESRMNPYRRRKNKYRSKKRKNRYEQPTPSIPSQDFYEDKVYDDTYYDRDSSYSAPSSGYKAPTSTYDSPASYDAPAYEAPAPSYEAPSYEAPSYEAPSYEAPSYKPAPSYEAPSYSGGGGGDSFNDFLNALAAFLPIGLFLAAIPPNLIVINSRRKRQAEDEAYNTLESSYPFMDKISKIGFSRLSEVGCQKELFCEMAEMGSNVEANSVQKLFGYTVSVTPNFVADMVGVRDVFEATREGRCRKFKCQN